MITLENVGEWMMVQSSLRHAGGRDRMIDRNLTGKFSAAHAIFVGIVVAGLPPASVGSKSV